MKDRKDDLLAALKTHFGYAAFRGVQQDAISAALDGLDSLVVMPTGGGKSLCYSLPALLLPGIALVVSPLIALMQDQVAGLTARGIRAAHLASSLPAAERRRVLAGLQPHRLQLDLLFVTPESLATEGFMAIVQALHAAGQLAFVAVDEAHCISSWGHDFRPAYRKLRAFRAQCPGVAIMALTATATAEVRRDICATLRLRQPRVLLSSFNRPNISYAVHFPDIIRGPTAGEHGVIDDNTNASGSYPLVLQLLHEHCGGGGSAIVYAHKRQDATAAAGFLAQAGLAAAAYHAGMPGTERDAVLRDWQEGRVRVVAATVAFGMGIDKADVRLVVHLAMPKSLEGFYQESGRAGRDGAPAHSALLYRYSDRTLHEYLITKESRRRKAKDQGASQDAQGSQRALAALHGVVAYCMEERCRRAAVLQHFGEQLPQGGCTGCDVCSEPQEVRHKAEAQRAFEAQARITRASSRGAACGRGGGGGDHYGAGEYTGSDDQKSSDAAGGSGSGSDDDEGDSDSPQVQCSGRDVKEVMASLAAAEAAECHAPAGKRGAADAGGGDDVLLGRMAGGGAAFKRPRAAAATMVDDATRQLAQKQLHQKLAANETWGLQGDVVSKLSAVLEAAMHSKCAASKQEYHKVYRELVGTCKGPQPLLAVLQPFLRWPTSNQAPSGAALCRATAAAVEQWQDLVAAVLEAQLSLLERCGGAEAIDTQATPGAGSDGSGSMASRTAAGGPGLPEADAVQVLRLLEQLPVSKPLLSGTGAGVRMNRLAKTQDGCIAAAAADVVKAWRRCVGK